jgi:DNA-binding response OmpR family regulator
MTATPPTSDGAPSAPRARALIIEDDAALARLLQAHLQSLRFAVDWAADGHSGLQMALLERPDLVFLDIGLPDIGGHEVCRRLRAQCDVPIIFLTSACGEEDIVKGLYQGADGYICKPVGLAELAARVEATLRHRTRHEKREREIPYDDGVLHIDVERGLVRKRGQDVPLAPRELRLLCYLVQHAGEIAQHKELLQAVWGAQYLDARNYLALYMRYLRLKIEDDPANPQYLVTRFGIGYSFQPRTDSEEGAESSLTQYPS